jgi:hypothetical protein
MRQAEPSSCGSRDRMIHRFRWQIELLFKEWKSYANLHKFDTANAHIAAGSSGPAWVPRCRGAAVPQCRGAAGAHSFGVFRPDHQTSDVTISLSYSWYPLLAPRP